MVSVTLPEWFQWASQLGALGVLIVVCYLFVGGKVHSDKEVQDIRAAVEKRVDDLKDELAKTQTREARLMDLMIGYKSTAREAIDHIPEPPATRGGRR